MIEEDDDGISLASPDGEMPTLDALSVPEVKEMKSRLHLDLRADGTSFEAEVLSHKDRNRPETMSHFQLLL